MTANYNILSSTAYLKELGTYSTCETAENGTAKQFAKHTRTTTATLLLLYSYSTATVLLLYYCCDRI
jgi:hypothetical protein